MRRINSRRTNLLAWTLITLLLGAQACTQPAAQDRPFSQPASATSTPHSAAAISSKQPGSDAAANPFDGEWAVAWCDKSRPEVDCGGFNLGLIQNGNRLCGTYDSARVGLVQVDEGGRITGAASSGTALLTVESERSGGKYTAAVSISGDQLRWKLQDTLQEGTRDIDIIAIDEKLARVPLQADVAAKHAELASDCAAQMEQ